MPRVVIIGDAHVDDEQSLARFKAAGKFIADKKPDYVVIIGDFLTLNCLSAWDRNKRLKMENRRYFKEIAAGNLALDYLHAGMKVLKTKPKLIYIKGNHENRLDRYLDTDPTFVGSVSIEADLKLKERGWTVVEYKDVYYVDGVAFTHIPVSSNGSSIGNPTVAQKALRLFSTSVVFGHTHTLDHAAEHRHGSKHLCQALSVGCFFEKVDEYAQGSKTDYWRGLVTLDIYHANRFDIETTSLSNVVKKYG